MAKGRRLWHVLLLFSFTANSLFLLCIHWTMPLNLHTSVQKYTVDTSNYPCDATTITSAFNRSPRKVATGLNTTVVEMWTRYRKNLSRKNITTNRFDERQLTNNKQENKRLHLKEIATTAAATQKVNRSSQPVQGAAENIEPNKLGERTKTKPKHKIASSRKSDEGTSKTKVGLRNVKISEVHKAESWLENHNKTKNTPNHLSSRLNDGNNLTFHKSESFLSHNKTKNALNGQLSYRLINNGNNSVLHKLESLSKSNNKTKTNPNLLSSQLNNNGNNSVLHKSESLLNNHNNMKNTPKQLSSRLNNTKMTRLDFILDNLQDFPPDEYLSKEASFFTPRPTLVHRSFPRVLMNCSRCPETGPVLLVIVPSVVQHVKHREAIRSTWASPVYGQLWPRSGTNLTDLVKLVFFFGVGGNADILRQECKHYGDIVQADFTENYRNLSLKMAAALQWSVAHCAGAGHVMKVDEDTFVNLPLAYDLVKTLSSHRSNYILGFKHHIDKPPVVRKGKWNVEKDLYPFPKFPRYLTGPSYLMSGNAAKALASTSKRMPLIPNEDAYVTGILAKAAGVQRIHSPSFAHEKLQYRPCELVDGRSVSQTRFKPYSKLYDIWRMLTKGRCDKH